MNLYYNIFGVRLGLVETSIVIVAGIISAIIINIGG